MMANVFACLHWTPETFWNLTTDQYIAAMYGLYLMNHVEEDNGSNLSDEKVDELKDMMNKAIKKEKLEKENAKS